MKKKYAIHPGPVQSKNDGQIHHISAAKLMHLYGVNKSECVVVRWGSTGIITHNYINLYPRCGGDYRLPPKDTERSSIEIRGE